MSSNGVVSIRVEALGVSITIAGGSIAIEQMKTDVAPRVEVPAVTANGAVQASATVTERVATFPKGIDDRLRVRGNLQLFLIRVRRGH
jgi:hypothetical protein